MLFHSPAFIYGFLPLSVAGFFVLARHSHRAAILWLIAASLVFYGWSEPWMLSVLLVSIAFNYGAGLAISRTQSRFILVLAIAANLSALAYFKYLLFAAANLGALLGINWQPAAPILPLGISFFTFTQIAFLVDAYRRIASEYRPSHYALFVTYYPHLIAGPIYHHREIIPQFAKAIRFTWESCAVGLSIFTIGLAKKVFLADYFGRFADLAFAPDAKLTLIDSWAGALSFALQIYFDFSAYTDMAIGISRIFGIVLPANFFSPYKATSIIEFWRRWHMTLSRFLRDYLYIPLGGNRRGSRTVNLMLTMLLGGLWHGASWNFVIWGGLHGLYLTVNHLWRQTGWRLPVAISFAVTFLAVVLAWVFFRADTTQRALEILSAMIGLNGLVLPTNWRSAFGFLGFGFADMPAFGGARHTLALIGGLAVVWLAPNTLQIFAPYGPVLNAVRADWMTWRPRLTWALAVSASLFAAALTVTLRDDYKPFIYFQF